MSNYPVHFDNENFVTYEPLNETSRTQAVDRISLLERYFTRPLDPEFNDVKYLQYYENYAVVTDKKQQQNIKSENWWDDIVPQPKTAVVRKRQRKHLVRMDVVRL